MAKKFEAGLEIKADVQGTQSIVKLASEIDAVGVDASELRTEALALAQAWKQLENSQALIASFKSLKEQTNQVTAKLSAAQAKVAELAREMKSNPTAELEERFQAAIEKTKSLTNQQEQLKQKLSQTRTALDQAGVSVKNLGVSMVT